MDSLKINKRALIKLNINNSARGSWRDPSEKFDGDEDAKSGLRRDHKGSTHRSFDSHAPQMRRIRNASGHHDFHDHLPEWYTIFLINKYQIFFFSFVFIFFVLILMINSQILVFGNILLTLSTVT